jgi:DNA-binding beta-propeller fold protein YncE
MHLLPILKPLVYAGTPHPFGKRRPAALTKSEEEVPMRLKAPIVLAAILLAPLYSLHAQSSLLILSKQDHTLAIVDPATLQVVAKAPVGEDPHEVIASSDGATAYVSNYGGGAYHTLAVIDLVSHQPLASIELGPLRGPHGLTFVGGKTWFTAEAAKAIGRFDPATRKVDWILGTGQDRTHMIDVSPDQKQIITTNVSSGTVSVFDLAAVRMPGPPPGRPGPRPAGGPPAGAPPAGGPPRTDWNQTIIRVGNGSEGFDLSPQRKELWVANAQDGTISIIDLPAKKVVETLTTNVAGANRLKFTPDGRHVLVSTLGGPDLVILDAATRKVVQRIPIGHGAAGILVEPSGDRAFIACTPDDYVAVLDLHTFKVIHHIQAGPQPDGMAWATHP